MKYYFISFTWNHPEGAFNYENKAIQCHPMEWLNAWRENNEGDVCLLVWSEISKEQFEAYNES